MEPFLTALFAGQDYDEQNFFLIAGPCVVEDKALLEEVSSTVASHCRDLGIPYIFKASYRKANRSRVDSFAGLGDEAALRMLAELRSETGLPVTTDIHAAEEASMAAGCVDILQIPAFLCRQTDLLQAAAATGRIVNIKKGQFVSGESMRFAAEKVRRAGNNKVILTERGNSFGYQDLVVDFRNIPILQSHGTPVVLDCTHSLQQPNQPSGVTGGHPGMIAMMARAGMAAGADGIFLETHPTPSDALSDGANMLPLHEMRGLLESLVRIRKALIAQS